MALIEYGGRTQLLVSLGRIYRLEKSMALELDLLDRETTFIIEHSGLNNSEAATS